MDLTRETQEHNAHHRQRRRHLAWRRLGTRAYSRWNYLQQKSEGTRSHTPTNLPLASRDDERVGQGQHINLLVEVIQATRRESVSQNTAAELRQWTSPQFSN